MVVTATANDHRKQLLILCGFFLGLHNLCSLGFVCFDCNLFGLERFALGKRNVQHAILKIGSHILWVHARRQSKRAAEFSVPAFDPVEVVFLFLALKLALTGDNEHVVFQSDVQVFLLHSGHLCLKSWFTRSWSEVNSKKGSLRVILAIAVSPFSLGQCVFSLIGLLRSNSTTKM